MKARISMAILSIFLFTGCATIFDDDFDADVVGGPPSTSPAGNPLDDSLNLSGPADSILVIASVADGSNAVRIERTAMMPQTFLECVTGNGPHTSGGYLIGYSAYSTNTNSVPELSTTVKSNNGQRAFELTLAGGDYRLSSGVGVETLPGGYAANVVHKVAIAINMDERIFSILIDGAEAASEKPFLDADFADVHLLSFEYPAPLLEAFSGAYVVDDIKIVR